MSSDEIKRQSALVLGGGGARGALQAGAVRAFCERGYKPDLVVGTSAGAINATFLALEGFSAYGIQRLEESWREAAALDLLPSNYLRLALRSMLRPSAPNPAEPIREFLIDHGLTPSLRFGDLGHAKLIVVSSDLNTGKPILHGTSPDESVLEAVLVSTALPPWSMPVRKQEKYLMDGAVVSGLPVEPALQAGATEVVALDLMDARDPIARLDGIGVLINKLTYAVEQRQVDLELALAAAKNVPVFYVDLVAKDLNPIWDFGHADELIAQGYEIGRRTIEERLARGAVLNLA